MVKHGPAATAIAATAIIDNSLSGLHQPGSAGYRAGCGLAPNAARPGRAPGLGRRADESDHCTLCHLQPGGWPADEKISCRANHGRLRPDDLAGHAGLRSGPCFRSSSRLHRSLRAGAMCGGQRSQRPYGPPLFGPSNELDPQLLGPGGYQRPADLHRCFRFGVVLAGGLFDPFCRAT